MKAIIISIGDELVLGQAADTNAVWLSQQLPPLGITVTEHVTVGDDIDAVTAALTRTGQTADVLLVTGGLGPTDDDLTRYALAKVLAVELELRRDCLEQIEKFFLRMNREMSPTNRVQAMIPAGCEVLANQIGTAPGISVRLAAAAAFFLPGVPSEMKKMFDESVKSKLQELISVDGVKGVIVCRALCVVGTGESNIAQMLGGMMARGRNPLVNSTVADGMISIKIIARSDDETAAQGLIEPVEMEIRKRLGDLIFGCGDETLAGAVADMLRRQRRTLAVAESCTGGWLAKELTDSSGASEFLQAGWVTYSNRAKTDCLGVSTDIIDSYGAVSEQVAGQLAAGARQIAQTDYGLGITGIAGPTGGTDEKPVGLVYIALADETEVKVIRNVFPGDRDQVRRRAVNTALDALRHRLIQRNAKADQ